jgi:hypothetical protein
MTMKAVLNVTIIVLASFHLPVFAGFASFGFGPPPKNSCEENLKNDRSIDSLQNEDAGSRAERFRVVRNEFQIEKNSLAEKILQIMQSQDAVSQLDPEYAEFNRHGGACGPVHILNLLSVLNPKFMRTPECMTTVVDGIAELRKKDPRMGTSPTDIEVFLNYLVSNGDLPKISIQKSRSHRLEASPRSVILLGVRTGWDRDSGNHWLMVLAVDHKNSKALVVDSNFSNDFDVADIAQFTDGMALISAGFTYKMGDRFVYPQDELRVELK